MNAVLDFKQERSFKTFIITLYSTITLMLVSTAMLMVITLSGTASADSGATSTGATYTGIAPTYAQTIASNQSVDTAGLVLFTESNLKGPLK